MLKFIATNDRSQNVESHISKNSSYLTQENSTIFTSLLTSLLFLQNPRSLHPVPQMNAFTQLRQYFLKFQLINSIVNNSPTFLVETYFISIRYYRSVPNHWAHLICPVQYFLQLGL